jgi:hypothetical protein
MNIWVKRNVEYGFSDDYLADFMDALDKKMVVRDEDRPGKMKVVEFENILGHPKLGKVLCLNKMSAEKFKYDKAWACISIADHKHKPAVAWGDWMIHPELSSANRRGLLELEFTNADGETYKTWRGEVCDCPNHFSKTQAKSIVSFVRKMWDEIDLLMVQCYDGGSRSRAVSAAILDVYHPKFTHYLTDPFTPNQFIYHRLKEEFEC